VTDDENDGWRAHVLYEDRVLYEDGALRMALGRRIGRGAHECVVGIDAAGGLTLKLAEEGTQVPTFLLPSTVARALLDALAQHFGGTGDVRQLRKEHDAERARVDKLIATLSTVATRGQP
jgi:hypothetical protein